MVSESSPRALAEPSPSATGLLVFADDWGRHPSSCQHLVRRLLPSHRVWWVNTIGTRPPRLDWTTVTRGIEKISGWLRPRMSSASPKEPAPKVVSPWMWPWFSRPFDRRLNRQLLVRQLEPLIRSSPSPPVAVTTLPIVADIMAELPVARWVYYCVDDFGQWPGLDQAALAEMENRVIARSDVVIAVSDALRERLQPHGKPIEMLTHGVDLSHWADGAVASDDTTRAAMLPADLETPLILFWGLIDRRLDTAFVAQLARDLTQGTIMLVGPTQAADPRLDALPRVRRLPAVDYAELPSLARRAAVLVMPYADLPVTRAMQPLKLKEYLATGRPVVVRRLPATAEWSDCLDAVDTPDEFSAAVRARLSSGLPPAQAAARARLSVESWEHKAQRFAEILFAPNSARPATGPTSHPLSHSGANGHTGPSNPIQASPTVVLHTRVVTGTGGGPDKTILNSPRFLVPHGYRALCAYMHPADDPGFQQLQARAAAAGAPLISIPERGRLDSTVPRRLLDVCRRERVAIWHGHDYKSNALGVWLRRRWPMRLVTTVHGWVKHTRKTPLYYAIDRLALRFYERVICVSDDLLQACLDAGVRRERCVLVENAIDTDQFRRRLTTADAKQRLGFPADKFVVGAVGRLSAEKGFDLLIRVVARLNAAGRNVHLVIAGEGDALESLRELSRGLGCADSVQLLGYRSDTIDLYQACDAFALSSLREGLPNVVLEALALETPVVATRIAGVPRVIADGANGLLVEPGSEDPLAAALTALIDSPELRGRLAAAGRRTVEDRYSFSIRMAKIRAIYDDLLSSPRRARVQP